MQQLGRKALGRVRPCAALVLVMVLAAVLGPGWLSPAGAAGPVLSSAMIPLSGTVGNVRLTGVVHVVTQFLLQEPTPFSTGFALMTVSAYLPPSDVTAVDSQGIEYLAHGAGTTTVVPVPDGEAIQVGTVVITGFFLMPVGTNFSPIPPPPLGDAPRLFSLQLHLSFLLTGELDAIHNTANVIDLAFEGDGSLLVLERR